MIRLLLVVLVALPSCYGARMAALEKSVEEQKKINQDLSVRLQFIEMLLKRVAGEEPTRQYVAVEGRPSWGPKDAKVTIVKAYEFACGYCYEVRAALRQLRKEYPKDVRIVFYQYLVHPRIAEAAGRAVCAADKQGKYTEMFDAVWDDGFRNQDLSIELLSKLAKKTGLDMAQYQKDFAGVCKTEVAQDHRTMSDVGISATPSFLINGKTITGALPIDAFREIVDAEILRADKALSNGVKRSDLYNHLAQPEKPQPQS